MDEEFQQLLNKYELKELKNNYENWENTLFKLQENNKDEER